MTAGSRRRRGAPPAVRADPPVHRGRAVLPDGGHDATSRAATCSRAPPSRPPGVVIPAGELTPETLAAAGDPPPGESRFLRYVQRPLSPIELARFNGRPDRPRFQAPGRLARVGLLARMLDAGLLASLLVRGKVPGGTAAAAAVKYEAQRAADPRIAYHGRVIRRDGWVVLQYLFFYAMNDWRSTFEGANDHEADWEQAFVILEDTPDGVVPAWFAAAAHDEKGADLRRRWDDPRLQRDGDHVVVNPGAGSHATYLETGEYIMRLGLPGASLQRGDPGQRPRVLARPAPPARSRRPRRDRSPGWPASRSWTTPVATASGSGPASRSSGRRSSSTTTTAGWTPTAACGASTPATGWPASGRPPARSTPGPARCASRGTTRWASWGWPACRRRPRRARRSRTAVVALDAERDDLEQEAAALDASLPGLERGGPGARRGVRRQGLPRPAVGGARRGTGAARVATIAVRGAPRRGFRHAHLSRPLRRRLPGRSPWPSPARGPPGAAGPDEATGVRGDMGRVERRDPGPAARGAAVVPVPAPRPDDRGAGAGLPRDRVVRAAAGRGAAAPGHRRAGRGVAPCCWRRSTPGSSCSSASRRWACSS